MEGVSNCLLQKWMKRLIFIHFQKLFIGNWNINNDIHIREIISAKFPLLVSLEIQTLSLKCTMIFWHIRREKFHLLLQESIVYYSFKHGFSHNPKEISPTVSNSMILAANWYHRFRKLIIQWIGTILLKANML